MDIPNTNMSISPRFILEFEGDSGEHYQIDENKEFS
jgi:hypothetical protein